MGESQTAEVAPKAFTPKAIIVGIIGSIALVLADSILGPVTGFVATAEVSVMTVVILAIIQMYTNIRFSIAEYVAIYAMVYGAAATFPGWFFWVAAIARHSETPGWWPDYAKFTPGFLSAPKELLDLAMKGQTAPPYGALLPQFIIGFVLIFVLILISIFGLMPLRRQIVEIERLPYPATTAAFTAVSMAVERPPEEKVPVLGSRRNWLVVGLLFGILATIFTEGYMVSTLFPGAPTLPKYVGDRPDKSGILWGLLPGAVLGIDISNVFPWSFFFYFAPMDALITIAIITILFDFVVTPGLISAGILDFDPAMTIDDLYFTAWFVSPYKYHQLGVALLIGGVIGGYIAAYKYIVDTMKDKNPEYDFLSPQMQWIMSFATVIVLTAIGVAIGAPVIPAFVLSLFLVYILQMWGVRGLGEVNLQYTWDAHASSVVGEAMYSLGLIGTAEPSSALVGFTMLGRLFTRGDIGASAFFESSRFAFLGRVNTIKTILIAIIIGLVIGQFGGQFFQAYLNYTYGLTHETFGSFVWGLWVLALPRARNYVRGGFTYYGPNPEQLVIWLILIVIGAAIPVIRGRVAFAIPFSVIVAGLAVLESADGNLSWGYPAIVILIIKWIVTKLGGTKLDEQVARPFFAGAAAGGLLGAVFSGIAAAIKALG